MHRLYQYQHSRDPKHLLYTDSRAETGSVIQPGTGQSMFRQYSGARTSLAVCTALFAVCGNPTAVADEEVRKNWFEIHTPVGSGFTQALQDRTSADTSAWVQELGEYYRQDGRLVYRGMCDRGQTSIEDLLQVFVSVSTDLLSQGITHKRERALSTVDPIDWTQNNFDLRRSILADLSRYNRDAYNFTLYREANAHQLGPVPGNEAAYANSYGFSTSWSYTAAVDF